MGEDIFEQLLAREQADAHRRAALAYAEAQHVHTVPLFSTEARGAAGQADRQAPSNQRRRRSWVRQRLRQRRLPGLPRWLEALITALVTTVVAAVIVSAAGVFWLWGATYTLQGVERGLDWLANTQNLGFVLNWWRSLGLYRWTVPLAFSLAEMIWAPIRRFLPQAQGPVLICSAIFSAVDIFTTHLGLPIRQPWRLLGAVALTFLPEASLLWALRLIAEAWLNVWDALRQSGEA